MMFLSCFFLPKLSSNKVTHHVHQKVPFNYFPYASNDYHILELQLLLQQDIRKENCNGTCSCMDGGMGLIQDLVQSLLAFQTKFSQP